MTIGTALPCSDGGAEVVAAHDHLTPGFLTPTAIGEAGAALHEFFIAATIGCA